MDGNAQITDSFGVGVSGLAPKGAAPAPLFTDEDEDRARRLARATDAVRDAMRVVMDGEGISLSRRRITLSTSGVVPEIARCAEEIGCLMAVSFHATTDEVRSADRALAGVAGALLGVRLATLRSWEDDLSEPRANRLSMMAGLLKPTAGEIYIDGTSVLRDPAKAKQVCGFIPDRPFVYGKLTGRELSNLFLEEMLADPMVQLVMKADGVSEAHLRHLYSGSGTSDPNLAAPPSKTTARGARDEESIRTAENEGMPTRPDSPPSLRTRLAAGKT